MALGSEGNVILNGNSDVPVKPLNKEVTDIGLFVALNGALTVIILTEDDVTTPLTAPN